MVVLWGLECTEVKRKTNTNAHTNTHDNIAVHMRVTKSCCARPKKKLERTTHAKRKLIFTAAARAEVSRTFILFHV